MATSVRQAIVNSELTVYARFGGANIQPADQEISIKDNHSLNSASTPDVDSPPYSKDLVLTGGADNIDLLDGLTDPEGNAMNLNGKKVRAIKFRAPAANTGNITITVGGSNAYLLLGAAWSMVLAPGQHVLAFLDSDAPTIDATHTNIAYSGTLNDILEVVAIFG